MIYFSGWGATSSGGSGSNQLLEVTVQMISRASCQAAYSREKITSRMICAAAYNKGRNNFLYNICLLIYFV